MPRLISYLPGLALKKTGAHGLAFPRLVARRFVADKCLQTASALAYTTLLSLVPLMATIFSVFSAFPMFKSIEADIQNFVFSNFVPASGELVQSYLQNFTRQTSNLTIAGIGFLVAAALLMLGTIDKALNTIWRTRKQRSAVRSFMVYWAILTLGPLLIGIGVFASSYLISLLWWSGMEPTTWQRLLGWLPFLSSAGAFTLLYTIIPNRRVPLLPALSSSLFAAVLFEIAKKGFALYAVNADAYQTIYGALATVPLFLLWIYVSWVIILLGAELAYCLSTFDWRADPDETRESDGGFMHAFRLLGHLWQAQCRGQALDEEALRQREAGLAEIRLRAILDTLENARWVCRTEDNEWVLARDLGETRLLELYRLMTGGLLSAPGEDEWNRNLQALLARLNDCAGEIMDQPLKTLYQARHVPAAEALPGSVPP